MKRINYIFLSVCWLLVISFVASANPVTKNTAQSVAANFYSRNFKSVTPNLILVYTESSNDGNPAYYVFNINTDDGFVIVSAEDAAHPILGYSNKGHYVIPQGNSNLAWWMNCRKQEIERARTKNIAATAGIAGEWTGYINKAAVSNSHAPTTDIVVAPLVQSAWNQSPYFNDLCPGGSVTGCVATAMAQIMKYWSYPPHGNGSSFYWDEQAYNYQNNLGYLSANYDTSNYIWSAMTDTVNSSNNQVAKLMYDCGVSVDMDYGYESGAWVITGDYPVCSQVSYVKYFGYNPATIQGLNEFNYSTTNWTNLIKNELNNKRPVQYVGFDSTSPNIEDAAGHTWVCDGYDVNNNFHMNWGWGGSDNAYFALNALDVGYQFNWWDEAVIGIEPPPVSPYFVATPTFGCTGTSVQFTDRSITDSNLAITSHQWLFPGATPPNSTDINPTVVYNTPGTYDVTEMVSTERGTDTLVRQAYISVGSASSASLTQDFQSSTFPPAGWVINNPNNYSYTWQLNTNVGGYDKSTQCMYFNNCEGYDSAPPGTAATNIIGERQQIYTPEYNYTGVTNPVIYFNVAYAPCSSSFSDTLVIYYSTDCGTTFTPVYSKGGMVLSTVQNYIRLTSDTNAVGCFVPSSTEWRTDTIHIPAIAGESGVMFSFENRSGNGSPLYIDNINIPVAPTAVPNVSSIPSIRVYPNPNNGEFTIGFNNIPGAPYVKIYNVLGQEVYTAQLKNENTQINLSSQPNGVYIYRIFSETGSAISTGRLVIE